LNHPVKELIWVFQDARKTDCGSTTTATAGYTQPFSYDDIADRCRLQINGQDRFDERYGDYFWKVQPYQHHSGGGFWPARNEANAVTVSGTPNAGVVAFTLNAATATSHTYTLTGGGPIVAGMLLNGTAASNLVITAVSVTDATTGTITTASFTSTASAYTAANPTGTGNNGIADLDAITSTGTATTTYQAANPINVYSFALQPEEHQPSGTCNFSRIDTTTLVFDSVTSGGAGTFPSKAFPYNFRIYAVNYNIFRVMSGMGGLAYSN
jgi:hypothetical protein